MSDILHAGLDLLDRQIIDAHGDSVGKIDDLELSDIEEGYAPRLVALLLGPQAYGERLGGRMGVWIASHAARLSGTHEPIRIPVESIKDIGVSIKLKVLVNDVERVEGADHWLRDHFIGRIPGGRDAS